MNVTKRVLAELEAVYAVSQLVIDGKLHFVAATESYGSCLLFSPPDWTPSVVWDGPGGTMTLCQLPDRDASMLAIQRFFPIFKSEEARIVLARAGESITEPWTVTLLAEMPFAHRCDVVSVGGAPYLVAASLCGGKDYQDDWSRPGAVCVSPLPTTAGAPCDLQVVLSGISKNHGLQVATIDGRQTVLVSGEEGLWAIRVPDNPGDTWQSVCMINGCISDVYSYDLDRDGEPEMVTIEPFHGDILRLYKRSGNTWNPIFESDINFGHAIWAGAILGAPTVIVGSRGGEKNLTVFQARSGDLSRMDSIVLDAGVGSTQVAVSENLVLSANHATGQVVMYEITTEEINS